MFVAVHNEKHLIGGTEMGGNFLRESGSHIPHSFLGYISSDKSGACIIALACCCRSLSLFNLVLHHFYMYLLSIQTIA